jgi:hypothetical protein
LENKINKCHESLKTSILKLDSDEGATMRTGQEGRGMQKVKFNNRMKKALSYYLDGNDS